MIYTSYFAKLKHLPSSLTPVSIALYPPRWYTGLKYQKLAPRDYILRAWKAENDIKQYIRQYNSNVLSNLTAFNVVCDLMIMSEGKDVVLLCYEKPDNFCHRHLVAQWFQSNGYRCEELF